MTNQKKSPAARFGARDLTTVHFESMTRTFILYVQLNFWIRQKASHSNFSVGITLIAVKMSVEQRFLETELGSRNLIFFQTQHLHRLGDNFNQRNDGSFVGWNNERQFSKCGARSMP